MKRATIPSIPYPSEAHFKLLADTIPQLVWITSTEGDVEFINARWFAYTGQTPGAYSRETWMSVVHRDDLNHVLKAHLEALKNKTPMEVEYRILRNDGIYRWHLVRTVFILDESSGRDIRFGTATDIHDQKEVAAVLARTQDELKASRDQLDVILQGVGSGIIAYDSAGKYIFANETAAKMSGFSTAEKFMAASQDDVITALEMCNEDGSPLSAEQLPSRAAFRGVKNPPSKVVRYQLKNTNETKWSILRSNAILDAKGAVKMVVTIFRDITDRKIAELEREKFHEESRKQEQIASFLDEANQVLSSSLDYPRTLGLIAKLAVPKLGDWCSTTIVEPGVPAQISVAHENPEMLALAEEFRKSYPTDWNAETGPALVFRSGQSQIYPVVTDEMLAPAAVDARHLELMKALNMRSLMMVPIQSHGKIYGVLTLISSNDHVPYHENDLKIAEELGLRAGQAIENSKLYEQAQQAIRSRDSLISVSAHELLTPVSGSKLQMQLMRKRMALGQDITPVMVSKMIDQTERQLDRLSRLVNEMLDLSRINLGKLTIERTTTDLSGLVSDIVDRMMGPLVSSNCTVSTKIAPGIMGDFDSYRLEQVLTNLLSNVARYARGKSVVVDLAMKDPDTVELSVADEGIGVRKEDLERIFQRFERAATIDEGSGLGLGLFVVRQIVEAHGGVVTVESTFGKGSQFTVQLPLREGLHS